MTDQVDHNAIRTALEDEKRSIERQLLEHGETSDGKVVSVDVDEGFADSAHATAERSEIISWIEQLHGAHGEVVAALERLDDGSYGKCEGCGQPIPEERLEALPTARLCVTCKQTQGS
jgi:DnaK suppressor protein